MKLCAFSISIACILFFSSCQPEGRIFVEHQKLSPDTEWLPEDAKTFTVPIAEAGSEYDMSLSFRFAHGYQYEMALIQITETSPSGEESVSEVELKIRDAEGGYIGEVGGDIWDSEHLISAKKKFIEAGDYTYKLEHLMPNGALAFAMEVGIILDQPK